jgi:large subunit ribosomal protein L5
MDGETKEPETTAKPAEKTTRAAKQKAAAKPVRAKAAAEDLKSERRRRTKPETLATTMATEASVEGSPEDGSPSRLKVKYQEVVPQLVKEFGYENVMQVPRLKMVVLNMGLGEAVQNPKALEGAESDLAIISGQHPVITRAKKSIAAFKLRTGMPIGMKVTLRGRRMYDFVDKLVNVVLPRIRDFSGVSGNSFDSQGNYHIGLKEQLVFPEIDYDKVDKVRGMQVSIITTARHAQEGKRLLELLGMPFQRGQENG